MKAFTQRLGLLLGLLSLMVFAIGAVGFFAGDADDAVLLASLGMGLLFGEVLTPEALKASVEELGTLVKDFRKENDKLLAEGKNTQREWTEKMQAQSDRIDQLELMLKRPALGSPVDQDVEAAGRVMAGLTRSARIPAYLKQWYSRPAADRKQIAEAYEAFLRKGKDGVTAEQRKALTLSDDTTGGYLATPETTSEIIKGVVEISPMRELAAVRQTSARSVRMRKRTSTFAAQWTVGASKEETAGLKYNVEEVSLHELYALVLINNEDLEDSDFNLESELNSEASEQFGVAEGAAFIAGSGVGRPEGIAVHAGLQAGSVISGAAGAVTGDGIINVFYGLKDVYAKQATWLMKRATIGSIRKLKDGQGNYIWQPGLGVDQPPLIIGRPYREAVDMPAVEAGAYPIAFGDFRRGYQIVDRTVTSVLRDPFSESDAGQVKFTFRRRVAGQVIVVEAIKLMKIAAA